MDSHGKSTTGPFQRIDHIAVAVEDIDQAVTWYTQRFRSRILYQDDTWALLEFANLNLALVIPEQHPPHLGFIASDATQHGPLKRHRDGTRSVYVNDPWGNSIELLEGATS